MDHASRKTRDRFAASAHAALRFLGTAHRRRRVRPTPGAPPGELVTSATAEETRICAICYDAGRCDEPRIVSADQLPELLEGDGRVVWVDVTGFADREALERVGQVFGIHPLALADAVHVPQRPKAEGYDDHLLIVTQMARILPDGSVDVEQLSLVLGPRWVVTFQERPGDVFDPLRGRLRNERARVRSMGADYLAYALIDAVVDGYFPVVEVVGSALEELEEEVMNSPSSQALPRIHAIRHLLLGLHRTQWRQRDAIGSLLRDEASPFSPAVHVYLRDAHDHAYQTLDAIETYRDLAVALMDVYLSIVSQRLNEVMKTLTIMASIFIPLSFIAGVYGMNFVHMPELHWAFGYPAALGLMGVVGFGLLAWFWRRGWLGSP